MCKFLSLMLLCNISMSFFDVSKISVSSGVRMLTFYVGFFSLQVVNWFTFTQRNLVVCPNVETVKLNYMGYVLYKYLIIVGIKKCF